MTSDQGFHALNISRRGFFGLATLAAGAGALASATLVASPAAAGAKFSQSMAKYQPTPKNGQACKACNQFQAPGACKVVEGSISADGWCMLYTH